MNLVIVESPAKAKTIGRYLGSGFVVESSVGHIRDIPSKKAELPEAQRSKWDETRFGVDVDNDFAPVYIVTPAKKKQVTKLRQELKRAEAVYLATDEDREGEAIAWHLLEVLKPKVPVHRMVFHEITPNAIREAVAHPRELDRRLVEAQEARRILDRLFGYEVSPVLWRRVQRGLSAGRVQSPATKLLVDRERERMAFISAGYAGIKGTFSPADDGLPSFDGTLLDIDGERVATGKDFSAGGEPRPGRLVLIAPDAEALAAELGSAAFAVTSVERKPYTRKPYAPFRTSTLQQEGGRKFRFGAQRTMRAAQRLYEAGFITYMRTDSTNLSESAIGAARSLVADRFGPEYLPTTPRTYGRASAGAQEAHEAIRPAGERFTDPSDVEQAFAPGSDEARIYDLVWRRTLASQMKDAIGESLSVRMEADAPESGRHVTFQATGRTISFHGFLRVYVEDTDDDAQRDDQERPLPDVAEGDPLRVLAMEATTHETKPPPRYTEASLVKRLEELGIGRPSTYASIMSVIQDRGYAAKQGTALVPTLKAFSVVTLLEDFFADYVDYDFTARMEQDLDRIASGDEQATPWLQRFYFGNGHPGLRELVSDEALEKIDAREVNSLVIGDDEDGTPIVARSGQFGPYLVRGEDRASIPEGLPLDELTVAKALEFLAMPSDERVVGVDPDTGASVVARSGRFGPYVQLGERSDENKKPKTASLFKSMSVESVTLDEALLLLQQPRVVGTHPEGGEILAQNGRYGPYLKWGSETRSLEREEDIFAIDLDRALAVLAQPKRRRGAAAAPLKELGDDPATGKPMVVRDGRYGPYVTDGETNASLRTTDTVEALTVDRAAELLAERRTKTGR
jgi:DNA topoisomerase-1